MSWDELAVRDGNKCILQLRGVRPFLSDKFDITRHKLLANKTILAWVMKSCLEEYRDFAVMRYLIGEGAMTMWQEKRQAPI